MIDLDRIRTKLYLGNIRCDVLLTEHDLLRKDILVFCGDLDVNFVATVFDPNKLFQWRLDRGRQGLKRRTRTRRRRWLLGKERLRSVVWTASNRP